MDPDDTGMHSRLWWKYAAPRIRYLTLVAALQAVADPEPSPWRVAQPPGTTVAGPHPEPWRQALVAVLDGVVASHVARTLSDPGAAQQVRAEGMELIKRGLSALEQEESHY
jgi:hypothetical protein